MLNPSDIGKVVKVRPTNGAQHWMIGFLEKIVGKYAIVMPFFHKGGSPMRVRVERVHVWTSRNNPFGKGPHE